jgi:hypothetical protein
MGTLSRALAVARYAAVRRFLLGVSFIVFAVGCETTYSDKTFRKQAEESYREVNAGWMIVRRTDEGTIFVRGDQLDTLPVAKMFKAYKASKQDGSDWFDAWTERQRALVQSRKRTIKQVKDKIIPIIKSASWVRVQDLGAIGPARMRDQIRPWRKEVTGGLYVVLGIPEEKRGYRFASIEEMKGAKDGGESWLAQANKNVLKLITTSTAGAASMEGNDGRLLVLDMPNTDGVSSLILDARFRAKILRFFDQPTLGVAIPNRNVLIFFDPETFTAMKPVRARTHELYDTQNHPGFRGLLRIDKDSISVLEGPNPPKVKLH